MTENISKRVQIMGREYKTAKVHQLFRERFLKLSQLQFCRLFPSIKQPNLSAHESGDDSKWLNSIARAYNACGFDRWLDQVATSPEEAELIAELLDEDSGLCYLTAEQVEALGLDTSRLAG